MKTTFKSLLMATALAFTATACGGGEGAKLETLSKKACECKDIKCFEGVEKEMEEVSKGLEAKYPNPKDAPSELMASVMKSTFEAMECKSKLK